MINKAALLLVSIGMLISGCASNSIRITDPIVSLDQDHRVIRHNFEKKYDIVEVRSPAVKITDKKNSVSKAQKKPRCNPLDRVINMSKTASPKAKNNKIEL